MFFRSQSHFLDLGFQIDHLTQIQKREERREKISIFANVPRQSFVSSFGELYAVTSEQEKATREILRSRCRVADTKLKTLAGTDPFELVLSRRSCGVPSYSLCKQCNSFKTKPAEERPGGSCSWILVTLNDDKVVNLSLFHTCCHDYGSSCSDSSASFFPSLFELYCSCFVLMVEEGRQMRQREDIDTTDEFGDVAGIDEAVDELQEARRRAVEMRVVTLFVDHSCGPPYGARAPSPVRNPLLGGLPKVGGYPPLGPFQPTSSTPLAGWMPSPFSVPHPAVLFFFETTKPRDGITTNGYYVDLGVLVHDLLPIHVLVTLLSAYVWSLRLEQRELNWSGP
ncbi:hypothetical protein F2Q68_00024518 [Brassica cretica]|uniref:Uncharacterized protein n=1 Tax=Brassica cretica TaxID=69181 RepID=A0A8S9IE53_BRACR|nr:hypothetical protein F2Q68_00024518 [Brassica cretica]